jgi:uncharacterized protein
MPEVNQKPLSNKEKLMNRNRGFRNMDPMKRREIASKGGKAAHAKGTAHQWTGGKEGTAALAGRKGGRISRGGQGRLHIPTPPPLCERGEDFGGY